MEGHVVILTQVQHISWHSFGGTEKGFFGNIQQTKATKTIFSYKMKRNTHNIFYEVHFSFCLRQTDKNI